MAISFQRIASDLALNGWFFEVDPSAANSPGSTVKPSLLIGQRLSTGTTAASTLKRVSGAAEAAQAHGRGSIVHQMVTRYRQTDPTGELWTIGVADAGGAVASTLALVATGPSTAAGTIYLYIAGQLVEVTVDSGDAATTIAASINTAINAAADLPVTCANPAAPSANLTLTARNAGVIGDEIDVRANYRGAAGGEEWPAGVTVTAGGISIETTPARLGGGAGAVDLTAAIAAMGDIEYDFIGVAWNADATLDTLEAELNDTSGRWSPLRPVYGHMYAAVDDTLSNITTAGNARNSQHSTLLGIESCPAPTWELAASLTGAVATARRADVAAVYHTLALEGILAPRESDRFTADEVNVLLTDGVTATYVTPDGTVRLYPVITTYQTDAFGQPDQSMLDVTTMYDLMHIQRTFKARMQGKFGRHRVADNGTNFGPGKRIVTPDMVKAETIALFREWEADGIVEGFDSFAELLIVERNATNPKRIDVLLPPNVTNAMETGAVAVQFRR